MKTMYNVAAGAASQSAHTDRFSIVVIMICFPSQISYPTSCFAQNNVGVGTTTPAAAALHVTSASHGFLPPRITTTQRNNIITPLLPVLVMFYGKLCLSIFIPEAPRYKQLQFFHRCFSIFIKAHVSCIIQHHYGWVFT